MKLALPILLVAGLLAGCGAPEVQSTAEVQAVAQVLRGTYDRPDSPLSVDPVVVRDGYAIAGWVQGEMGGRALLSKQGSTWSIILCAGDALKEVSYLAQTGMAAETAKDLAEALAAAESRLSPERLEMFSRFGPTVFMNQPGAGHPAESHDGAGAPGDRDGGHEH